MKGTTMSEVSDNIEKIRKAKYGEEVRSAIADSIEAIDAYASDSINMSVDYSKNSSSLNVIDPSRVVKGKRYSKGGLIDDEQFIALAYLVPIRTGDIIYQKNHGYLNFAFYDSMFNHLGMKDSTMDPLTVDIDGATYVGISLMGTTMDDGRVVRINNQIVGNGIPEQFDILYSPLFSYVDYSKNDHLWNLIDANKIVKNKKYTSNGLVETEQYESLDYLIPVNRGDILYQGGGKYLEIAVYDRYGSYITSFSGGDNSFEIPENGELIGVSISTNSGALLSSRILRLNHCIVGPVSPTNIYENRYFQRPVVLLDFDQAPKIDTDLRFSIMDEYGWTATTPLYVEDSENAKTYLKMILDHGWSPSLYREHPGYLVEDYSDANFEKYVNETIDMAYSIGFPNPVQWSARQNLSYEGLR